MKHLMLVFIALLFLTWWSCEKQGQEQIYAPISARIPQSETLKDSIQSLEEDLFQRIYLMDLKMSQMGNIYTTKTGVLPVKASDPVEN